MFVKKSVEISWPILKCGCAIAIFWNKIKHIKAYLSWHSSSAPTNYHNIQSYNYDTLPLLNNKTKPSFHKTCRSDILVAGDEVVREGELRLEIRCSHLEEPGWCHNYCKILMINIEYWCPSPRSYREFMIYFWKVTHFEKEILYLGE